MATMAIPNPSNPPSSPQPSLELDTLSHLDIRTLSQSELHALSLCSSSSTFDLHNHSDIVVPKIDRSIFNESAGSRRQTYSRPCRSQSAGHRRRVAPKLPHPVLASDNEDPERHENRSIINHLKHFISQEPKFDFVEFSSLPKLVLDNQERGIVGFEGNAEMSLEAYGGEVKRKRKRGRKPKVKVLQMETEGGGGGGGGGVYMGFGVSNNNAVAHSLPDLGNDEEPFGDELKRRTVGLESEEHLFGFLRELGGQWASRRKKRKIVDASEFGNALPFGWKLLLGLKRKEGHAWIYCRRYISPNGQQFVNCKDAFSYLQSFNPSTAQPLSSYRSENIENCRVIADTNAGLNSNNEHQRQDMNSWPAANVSDEHEKESTLLGMENLAEVQIHALFECHKCGMTFDGKDSYLQHLLSVHQRTTRRYRLGSSVGDGVIIRDGKYECQFCHKVFLERRRYNGHVGIHVRNYVRGVEELPNTTLQSKVESPTKNDMTSRISKMDALIEIAQNSILETSVSGQGGSPPDISHAITSPEVPGSSSGREPNINCPLSEVEQDSIVKKRDDLDKHHIKYIVIDGTEKANDAGLITDVTINPFPDTSTPSSNEGREKSVIKALKGKDVLTFSSHEQGESGIVEEGAYGLVPSGSQNTSDVENKANMNCLPNFEHPEIDDSKNNAQTTEVDVGNDGPPNNIVTESIWQIFEGNEAHGQISDSFVPMVQPSYSLGAASAISDKEEQLSNVSQRHDNITEFKETRIDDIESLNYNIGIGLESPHLQEVTMDLTANAEMGGAFGSSSMMESEELVMIDMAGGDQVTTVCVWCGIEFSHESIASEIQPDSVGFMCPGCKAKISGQVGVLDSGSPVIHHLP